MLSIAYLVNSQIRYGFGSNRLRLWWVLHCWEKPKLKLIGRQLLPSTFLQLISLLRLQVFVVIQLTSADDRVLSVFVFRVPVIFVFLARALIVLVSVFLALVQVLIAFVFQVCLFLLSFFALLSFFCFQMFALCITRSQAGFEREAGIQIFKLFAVACFVWSNLAFIFVSQPN